MSDSFEKIIKVFKHYDYFFNWLSHASKFYVQPKAFIDELISENLKSGIKKILEYFLLVEAIILILAATFIDKIQFGLFKIPALLILDIGLALPLITIVAISLRLAQISNPIKKSIFYVLLLKIFYLLPIQIFFFVFIFSENYVFYILFGAGTELFLLALLFYVPVVFAKGIKQYLIVQSVVIILFILLILTFSLAGAINPAREEANSLTSSFDPIFYEFVTLKNKAKLLDEYNPKTEIDKLEKLIKQDEERPNEINADRLREDQKYKNEILLKRVEAEIAIFSNEDSYYFGSNRRRFEKYLDFLGEIIKYTTKYYESFEVFDMNRAIEKTKKELEAIKAEIEKYPKFKIAEDNDMGLALMNENEKIKRLSEEIKQREMAMGYEELLSKKGRVEISILENKYKIQETISGIYEQQTRLYESMTKFTEEIMNYYKFVLAMRTLIFI